jgi:hypothetical protein
MFAQHLAAEGGYLFPCAPPVNARKPRGSRSPPRGRCPRPPSRLRRLTLSPACPSARRPRGRLYGAGCETATLGPSACAFHPGLSEPRTQRSGVSGRTPASSSGAGWESEYLGRKVSGGERRKVSGTFSIEKVPDTFLSHAIALSYASVAVAALKTTLHAAHWWVWPSGRRGSANRISARYHMPRFTKASERPSSAAAAAQSALKSRGTSIAAAVCCSGLFGTAFFLVSRERMGSRISDAHRPTLSVTRLGSMDRSPALSPAPHRPSG